MYNPVSTLLANKLIQAHVKVLAIAVFLFLLLGFVDTTPDAPGVLQECGLHSAQILQGRVAPDLPVTFAAGVCLNSFTHSTLKGDAASGITPTMKNFDRLSVAGDPSPPRSRLDS